MKTFTTYENYRGACRVRDYLTSHNIAFYEWHDAEGGYEFEATVTAEQYSELMNI